MTENDELIPQEFEWSELSNDVLMEQSNVYEGIVQDILDGLEEKDRKIIYAFIEIQSELRLRDGQ